MASNGKISLQKLYDEIMPIIKDTAEHTVKIENMEEILKEIKEDIKSKVSIKAFATWLTSLSIVVGIIVTILSISLSMR